MHLSFPVDQSGIFGRAWFFDNCDFAIGLSEDCFAWLRFFATVFVFLDEGNSYLGVFFVNLVDILGISGHLLKLTFNYNNKQTTRLFVTSIKS